MMLTHWGVWVAPGPEPFVPVDGVTILVDALGATFPDITSVY